MARNRPFKIALALSAAFHLSMVSVFSIEIWFPRNDLTYYSLRIVKQRSQLQEQSGRLARRDVLRVPLPDRLLEGEGLVPPASGDGGDVLTDNTGEDLFVRRPEDSFLGALPPIELPRLEFADMDRLRSREESLRIRSQYRELFAEKRQDSWARFSHELRDIGSALSRLTGLGAEEKPPVPTRVSNPAPGFALHIEWMSEPKDRSLLFSPPIPALWNLDAAELIEPIAVVFMVNPQGKVTEIQIPLEDDAGVVADIGGALLSYRFEPLDVAATQNQRGTLLVIATPWAAQGAAVPWAAQGAAVELGP